MLRGTGENLSRAVHVPRPKSLLVSSRVSLARGPLTNDARVASLQIQVAPPASPEIGELNAAQRVLCVRPSAFTIPGTDIFEHHTCFLDRAPNAVTRPPHRARSHRPGT
jgi:hypothetical protein